MQPGNGCLIYFLGVFFSLSYPLFAHFDDGRLVGQEEG